MTVGLFAARGADIALIGGPDGVKTIKNDLSGVDAASVISACKSSFLAAVKFGDLCHITVIGSGFVLSSSPTSLFCPAMCCRQPLPCWRPGNRLYCPTRFFDILTEGWLMVVLIEC